MDNEQISIIIPAYKTEKFIRACVESVLDQSYCNMQIILIDDGSPDHCGSICDEYAQRDQRVTVIHQENRGLSGAWNTGLQAAEGEWIGFVDSDDWVEPDMFEYLLRSALSSGADIAVCGICDEYRKRTQRRAPGAGELISPRQMLSVMENTPGIQSYVWNKLWRRELFEGLQFPGKNSGDIAIAHLLIERAERGILLLPECKYHYRFLAESISGDRSLLRCFRFLDAFEKRRADLYERWPELRDDLNALCVQASVRVWCGYCANSKEERDRYRDRISKTAAFNREHYASARERVRLGITGKAAMFLTQYDRPWAFALADLLSRLYCLKHERPL